LVRGEEQRSTEGVVVGVGGGIDRGRETLMSVVSEAMEHRGRGGEGGRRGEVRRSGSGRGAGTVPDAGYSLPFVDVEEAELASGWGGE
jgi:hypothetical protein